MYCICQGEILAGSSAGTRLSTSLGKCCFFFPPFRGVKVHICSERETCCYCTKTNRINLTSRGSGAETRLTTATGPSEYCTPPNQAGFWKCCHIYPGKKRSVRTGFRVARKNNRETRGRIRLLAFFFFSPNIRSSVVTARTSVVQKCVGSGGTCFAD